MTDSVVVETLYGPVRGHQENGVVAFLGVPYAAPVTMANRFDAPEPPTPWTAPRDATRLGDVCPQVSTYGLVGHAATSQLAAGEDFLTVNVRTPDVQGRAPVLVWIHGGGYAVGSANEPVLQSGAFAASGIVEVTVNSRLGALGFLHIPGKPDNRGLLDQIAALAWVRSHIAAFGGDPERITFAGRSAGGFSVAAIMAMPMARGLFARAMPQSGASTGVATQADAEKFTARMLSRMGIDLDGLTHAPLTALLHAQRDLCNESYTQHNFARDGAAAMLGVPCVPVIDGESLPEHPEAAAAAGRTAPVPMMTGCTTAEYLTHSNVLPSGDFSDADAARLLHERVLACGVSGRAIVDRYRAALPRHDARGIWRAVAGDLVFQNPCSRFARLHGAHQPVLKYLYGDLDPNETGAAHGSEVAAIWYRAGIDRTNLPPHQRVIDPGVAQMVHQTWCQFIRGAPAAAWPPFTADATRVLWMAPAHGAQARVVEDPFAKRPALWRV